MLFEAVLLSVLLTYCGAAPQGDRHEQQDQDWQQGQISRGGMRFINKITIATGFGPVFPPFLQNVSSDAMRSYFNIIENENISTTQQNQQLQDWASQNGVSSQLQQYLQAQQYVQNQLMQNASQVVQQLPSLFQQYQSIVNNNDIPLNQQNQQLQDLVNQNPMGASVIAYLMTIEQFYNAPDLWRQQLGIDIQNRGNQMGQGPMGQGPYGGYGMGPGPMMGGSGMGMRNPGGRNSMMNGQGYNPQNPNYNSASYSDYDYQNGNAANRGSTTGGFTSSTASYDNNYDTTS